MTATADPATAPDATAGGRGRGYPGDLRTGWNAAPA